MTRKQPHKLNMKTQFNQKGFTLIELLVVITIIAILASVSVPVFSSIQQKAKVNKSMQQASGIYKGIYALYGEQGFLPEGDNANTILAEVAIEMDSEKPFYVAGCAWHGTGATKNGGDNFHERTKIMAVSQFIGQFAWVLAPWIWIIIYDPNIFVDAASGTRILSIVFGIICTLLAIVPAIFIKSKSTLNDDYLVPLTKENIGNSLVNIFHIFKDAWRNIPFRKLCIATFLVFNSFQTIAAFSFFIIVHYLFMGDASAASPWPTLHGSVGAIVTTFIVIPIVSKMAQTYGKKETFIISQAISVIGYILFWFLFIPGKPSMFLFALPFFSFGIGGLFTLMMSMTADACDYEELENGLPRKEGSFGAIYWWMVKLGTALAGLLSGLIMYYVGFSADASTQPEGALTGLRIAYSSIPIIGTLIAIYVMSDYEIDEKKAGEIRKQLQERNGGPN